ncbi:MAG: hypothetical protein GMKNLPBB_02257 [Myxococcota bacterium]|nr:hypothetical protein [Myxococcota bacterium]
MVVGVATVTLQLHGCSSLKEKRGIIKSLIARVQNKFNCSAAEVDRMDSHEIAVLGFASVGNETAFVDSVMRHILNYVNQVELAQVIDERSFVEHIRMDD